MADLQYEEVYIYGQREHCFIDYQGPRFSFSACGPTPSNSSQNTDSDGIIHLDGLRTATLPKSNIDLDLEDNSIDYKYVNGASLMLPTELFTPLQYSPIRASEKKELTLELPLLKTNASQDLRDYFEESRLKRHPTIAEAWLPLASLEVERDESLSFPSYSRRIQLLVQHEFQCESITAMDRGLDSSAVYSIDRASPMNGCLNKCENQSSVQHPALTPPLSPMSKTESIFEAYIPDTETCFIDLTSEPSSPIRREIRRIQAYDEDEINTPHEAGQQQPTPDLAIQETEMYVIPHKLKIDVPIMSMPSAPSSEVGTAPAAIWAELQAEQSEVIITETDSVFDEALKTTLEARRSSTNFAVEQEQFDPTSTVARLILPLRDFSVSPPIWQQHIHAPQSMFLCMLGRSPECFSLPLLSRDVDIESGLKWTPIPKSYSGIMMHETLEASDPSVEEVSDLGDILTMTSKNFVKTSSSLVILIKKEEQELEQMVAEVDEISSQPDMLSRGAFKESDAVSDSPKTCSSLSNVSSGTLAENKSSALPLHTDSQATSKLIESFIELGAVKRPRLAGMNHQNGTNPLQNLYFQASEAIEQKKSVVLVEDKTQLSLALVPKVDVPVQKATYLMSISLGRPIIAQIESVWPRDHLIDKDYSEYDSIYCWIKTKQRKQVASFLPCEADLTLTPTVGVIVTNLLSVTQRSLPGSGALSQLREKIQGVCHIYESLIVLVSEHNSVGEYVGNLSASDMAAYADLVRFNTSLREGVRTYFVPGAERTLGGWLLLLMCQHSPEALALGRIPTARENTWEYFLRRSGMNVLAAQMVAASLLKEFGTAGLSRFLCMTVQERLLRYAPVLGGRKMLLKVSQLIDRPWA